MRRSYIDVPGAHQVGWGHVQHAAILDSDTSASAPATDPAQAVAAAQQQQEQAKASEVGPRKRRPRTR